MRALNTITLHYLQAFVLSAELGSVSAAARALGKRQSQLSGWVQDLEAELALELFVRSGNSLQLSASGQALLPLAQHLLAQSSRLQTAALSLQQHPKLVLNMGIAPHIPQQLLTPALVVFFKTQTAVQLQLTCHNEEILTQGLQDGLFDMVLLHESVVQHSSSYDYCRAGHYDEIMVVASDHPLARKTAVTTTDLAPFRELICAGQVPHQPDETGFSGHFSVINDFNTLIDVLQNTDCIALLPELMLQTHLQQGYLVKLALSHEQSVIRRRLELHWPLGGQHNSLIALWLSLVQQALNNQGSDKQCGR